MQPPRDGGIISSALLERREAPPSRINGKANPEYHRWWYQQNQDRVKSYRRSRSEITKRYMEEYRAKNKSALQAWARNWWSKNKKVAIAKHAAWLKRKGSEYLAARNKKAKAKMVDNLPDHYLHQCLEMPNGSLPPQFLETMRVNIKLKRLCRNQKTSTNSANNS